MPHEAKKELSFNKSLFKKQNRTVVQKHPVTITAAEVPAIINHYNSKKNNHVIIYKNGQTDLGQKLIEEKKAALTKIHKEKLASFENEKPKYINFLFYNHQESWGDRNYPIHWHDILGSENFQRLNQVMGKMGYDLNSIPFSKLPTILSTLSEADKNTINTTLQKEHPILDPLINQHKERIKNIFNANNICITGDDVQEEIKFIQKSLKPGQTVGYIYTNGVKLTEAHFEVLILTDKTVTKPISWYNYIDRDRPKKGINLNDPQTAYFALDKLMESPPQAQISKSGCGSLCFLYAKHLLQDNTLSLRFPFYTKEGQLQWFFYPPPQVLRYSQNSFFNEVTQAMLSDNNTPVTVEYQDHKKQDHKKIVPTIQQLLKESIQEASSRGDMVTAMHNAELLENLESFRNSWLEEYEKTKQKHQAMESEEGNKYLTYCSYRLRNKASIPIMSYDDILNKLQPMHHYGETLKTTAPDKGQAVLNLHNELKERLNAFFLFPNPLRTNFDRWIFLDNLTKLLHSQDEIMQEYRTVWEPLTDNFLLTLEQKFSDVFGYPKRKIQEKSEMKSLEKDEQNISKNNFPNVIKLKEEKTQNQKTLVKVSAPTTVSKRGLFSRIYKKIESIVLPSKGIIIEQNQEHSSNPHALAQTQSDVWLRMYS